VDSVVSGAAGVAWLAAWCGAHWRRPQVRGDVAMPPPTREDSHAPW